MTKNTKTSECCNYCGTHETKVVSDFCVASPTGHDFSVPKKVKKPKSKP